MSRSRLLSNSALSALLVAGLLVGCDGGADGSTDGNPEGAGPGEPRSGSRLEIHGSFSDGIGVPDSFYDTELNVTCFATELSGEDETHCVPSRFVEIFFSSDDCSDDGRVALVRSTCNTAEVGDLVYGVLPTEDSCAPRNHLFEMGDVVPAPSELYWRSFPSGACEPVTPGDDLEFHALEPASADSLVRVGLTTEEVGDAEVRVSGYAGDDGSFLPTGFRFGERDCSPSSTTEGTRCLPSAWYSTGEGFSDAECTEPARLVIDYGSRCGDPFDLVFVPSDDDSCSEIASVFRADGDPVTAYSGDAAACAPLTSPNLALEAREEVALEAFPKLEIEWVPAGELEASFYTSNGQIVGAARELRVAGSAHPCSVVRWDDDSLRCAPFSRVAYSGSRYADAACEIPLFEGYAGTCDDTPELDEFGILEQELVDGCHQETSAAYHVTRFEGVLHGFDFEGNCVEVEPDASSWYLERGERIDDEEIPVVPDDKL